jgi:hypothetical protein
MIQGGFLVTIPIRLVLYVGYIASMSLPLGPLPTPLKAVARGFLVLFHTRIEVHLPDTLILISF